MGRVGKDEECERGVREEGGKGRSGEGRRRGEEGVRKEKDSLERRYSRFKIRL